MLREKGLGLVNADLTLMAQAPKIAPHTVLMRERLAGALMTGPDRISIKATTTEGLGLVGRGEGMAALAVVLLARISHQDRQKASTI
jgi:2-C-methyl-D-erythritol 2,4-cyclodiphosphate synthase